MKVLLIPDVHLSDTPPSIRNESYADEILDKLAFAVELANTRMVDLIVQAGDLFHIKSPSRTSHRLVQATAEVLTQATMPVWIVPGNHDLQHDRLESLSKQPLGTLAKVQGIDLLMGGHPEFPVFGLPYLQNWVAQSPGWMRRYRDYAEQWEGPALLVTHAPIFPPAEEPPYDFIAAEDWARGMVYGDCYYGHIHDPHGVYQPNALYKVSMCNHGALSRGSLHEQTLKRKPAVTIWDSDAYGVNDAPPLQKWERIEVPHLPAEEVFRLAEKVEEDVRTERVSEFLDGVEKTVLNGLTVEEVVAHAEGMGLRPRTLEEIRSVIEEVSSR